MHSNELRSLFDKGKKRCVLVGTDQAGVLAGLDLEGRIFAILNGNVLNRVNPEAVLGTSTRDGYLNPGGDGLWPAPEGSRLGYEYATGDWRVPPGLSGARYRVTEETSDATTIRAECDLINAAGRGIPVAFERRVSVQARENGLSMTVQEGIEYLGTTPLSNDECLLAPWTLAQFDCGPGCHVRFPALATSDMWDLYEPSDDQRSTEDGVWRTTTDGSKRYQIGLGPRVDWIEYIDPGRRLRVRRTAAPLDAGLSYVDIADRPPDQAPDGPGIRYSVYSDTDGFMEIEAAGGCPARLTPGLQLCVEVTTEYQISRPVEG